MGDFCLQHKRSLGQFPCQAYFSRALVFYKSLKSISRTTLIPIGFIYIAHQLKIQEEGLPWWLSGKESRVLIPDPERSHMLQSSETCVPQLWSLCSRDQEPQLLSPQAAATEACTPWSPCSATREATAMRNLCTTAAGQLLLAATRENKAEKIRQPTQQQRPKIAQKKKKKMNK